MANNDELRRAAERLRQVIKYQIEDYVNPITAAYRQDPACVGQHDYHVDLRDIADAHLAELDETPVTEEWARSIAAWTGTICGVGCLCLDENKRAVIRCMRNMPFAIRGENNQEIRLRNPTIGQVRTACRMLGIELKESVK